MNCINRIELLRSSPEREGIPEEALLHTITALKQLDSLNSIMVLRHGKVCFEAWWKPYSPEIPHILFSLSKSFTSTAIGMAQAEGLLKITDLLISFFPEYESYIADPKMRKVSLRHLLTMSSGHADCARPYMIADAQGNWVRGFFSSPLEYQPGSHFAYNSAASYMLSAVIRKVTGSNVREYLLPRLFEPLKITPGIWECCPQGINTGGWGLYLKTEDLAKFAQLLLNDGVWLNKQIIPVDYLHEATKKQIETSDNEQPDWKLGYGYQFWQSRYGFRADGAAGQYALVIPEKDMVIAVTAGVSNMQQILTILWEHLIPEIKDEPLLENETVKAELAKAICNLQLPVAVGNLSLRRASATWYFQPNSADIKSVCIRFFENQCRLEFKIKNGLEILNAGFGFNCDNELQLNNHMKRKVAASAAWSSESVLELHLCSYEATFREVFRINFESPKRPLTEESRFCLFRTPFLPELETVEQMETNAALR